MKLRMYLRGLGLGLIVASLVMSFGIKTENKTMTDAQIRQRALELGMVDDNTTLKSAEELTKTETNNEENKVESSETVEVKKEEAKPEENKPVKVEKAEEPVKEEVKEETKKETKEEVKQETAEDKKAEKPVKEEVKQETETKKEPVKEETKQEPKKEEKEEKVAEPVKETVPANIMTSTKNYTLTIVGGYSSDRVAKILEGAGVVNNAAAFDKYLCDNGYDHRISTGTYVIPAGSDYAAIAKLITHSN